VIVVQHQVGYNHDENKLHFNKIMVMSDQHTLLDFYSTSSLKQQSSGKPISLCFS